MLTGTALVRPGAPAILRNGGPLTYGDLQKRVTSLAGGFRKECGVRRGDRIVICMQNRAEYLETLFACWRLGAVAVPVNARLHPSDVAYHAADCAATVIVHDDTTVSSADEADVDFRIRIGTGGPVAYERLIEAGHGQQIADEDLGDHEPAWIFYTSGTTGRPKGAVLTHGNLTFMIVSWCADLHRVTPEDVVLHCAPLSHGAGFYGIVAIARGAAAVIHRRFDPKMVLSAVSRHGVTSTWLVPTQMRLLLDAFDEGVDLSSLTHVIYGGSPIPLTDQLEAMNRFGPVLCQLYGQGETPMTISYLDRSAHDPRRIDQDVLTSAGIPRTGIEVRIRDDHGEEVPRGEVGEITVRGPTVMAGYLGRADESAEAMKDGFLYTGDLGRFGEKGYLYVLDRKKDLIISGGSNIYAKAVEDVLLSHPQVEAAAVFGVPDRIWGEALTAAVVCRERFDEALLIAHCRGRIAAFQVPKRIHPVDRLPTNAYGKVLKRELRRRFSQASGHQRSEKKERCWT